MLHPVDERKDEAVIRHAGHVKMLGLIPFCSFSLGFSLSHFVFQCPHPTPVSTENTFQQHWEAGSDVSVFAGYSNNRNNN